MMIENNSGQYQGGPCHTTHRESGRGNTALLQSGSQLQLSMKSAKNPGHRVEVTGHISNAVPTHNTPGNGQEHLTLGRSEAAYLQSGPHPQQVSHPPGTLCIGIHRSTASLDTTPETHQPIGLNIKMPPWYQEVTGNDPPRCYLRSVMQGVGTYHLHQIFSAQTITMGYKHFSVNIGFIRSHYVDAIFSFQNGAQYAPMNYKC